MDQPSAALLVATRGRPRKVEGVSIPDDPDAALMENGHLLPGPDVTVAGPTFRQWLTTSP